MPTHSMTRDEVRNIDRHAITQFGIPGIVLMENAGRGAADLLQKLAPDGSVSVCAGKGNNGGDGFVIARHLENRGRNVRVLLFCHPDELTGDAKTNFNIIQKAATPLLVLGREPDIPVLIHELEQSAWIVDALLGTGAQGTVREPYATVIAQINVAAAKVFAVDLPSGMDCDTGQPLGCCARADHTATFVARKVGFNAAQAAEYIGTVHVIDIGLPRKMLES